MATATFATFNKFTRQQNISIANDDVQNALAEAKSDAISHVVVKCNSGVLIGYEVAFSTPNTYSLREVCNPALASPNVRSNPAKLPTGVTFASSVTIRFLILGGGSDANKTVTITDGSQSKSISVDKSGVIKLVP